MKASPDDQLRLLDVQALDTTLDRLRHRRVTLPEHELIERLQNRIADLDDRIVTVETEDSDLGRDQAKLETDIEVVRGRMARDQKRLDDGQVASPRELESLQSEVASLHRRQTDLEDSELELMERREELRRTIDQATTTRDESSAELANTEAGRDRTLESIATQEQVNLAERERLAATLSADFLGLYEKVRAASGGVGAAALLRGRCEGCHLAINTTDLKAMREAAPDEVLRCEECRRILVRTPDSGL